MPGSKRVQRHVPRGAHVQPPKHRRSFQEHLDQYSMAVLQRTLIVYFETRLVRYVAPLVERPTARVVLKHRQKGESKLPLTLHTEEEVVNQKFVSITHERVRSWQKGDGDR